MGRISDDLLEREQRESAHFGGTQQPNPSPVLGLPDRAPGLSAVPEESLQPTQVSGAADPDDEECLAAIKNKESEQQQNVETLLDEFEKGASKTKPADREDEEDEEEEEKVGDDVGEQEKNRDRDHDQGPGGGGTAGSGGGLGSGGKRSGAGGDKRAGSGGWT